MNFFKNLKNESYNTRTELVLFSFKSNKWINPFLRNHFIKSEYPFIAQSICVIIDPLAVALST